MVKFSIYLNRRVFVIGASGGLCFVNMAFPVCHHLYIVHAQDESESEIHFRFTWPTHY